MNIRRCLLRWSSNCTILTRCKIGVLVAGEGSADELKSSNDVAASKPEFVNPEDVSAEVVEHERQIQPILRSTLVNQKKSQRKWLKVV